MRRIALHLGWLGLIATGAGLAHFAFAQTQFGSPYPYYQQPTPFQQPQSQLPPAAQHVGGLIGNPFQNSIPPSGLPVGSGTHNFFQTGIGNPVVHQPVQKPFSNLPAYRPLITSQEAARLEVARGLWRY